MKTVSPALLDLLMNQRKYFIADCYTFTLPGGSVLRYTSADADLKVDSRLFLGSYTPLFERGQTRTVRGVEVDSLDITVFAGTPHTVNGVPWLQAIASGALDNARVQLERAFAAAPDQAIAGTLILFSGRVSDSSIGSMEGRLTVRSDLELLNIRFPHNLYQTGCLNVLFDSGCAVSKAAHGVAVSVLAGSTRSIIKCSLAQAADYFTLGEILVTGGANSGVIRSVRDYVPGELRLSFPLPKTPTVGDAFTVWPGCDGRQSTCSGKYNNLARYRAFPYIPTPETAV